jgi:ElaB/YqjD/DUF883 family membrane-anchored ribosome-binding protein
MAGESRIPNEIKDTASNVSQRAQEAASGSVERAQDLASSARERAGETLANVGGKMSDLAGTIRDRAPQEGYVGQAAGMVASQLEAGGHYLQERGIEEMFTDLGAVIRNHPLPSLLVILGIGYMLGKATSGR